MKKYTLIILGLLIFQTSFSQKNYLPGHVITLEGDNLKGFIDNHNWGKTSDYVYFRSQIDSETIIYKPEDIREFHVQNEIYISAIVKIEISLPETLDPQIKTRTDTVFSNIVIEGEKSLYHYKTNGIRDQYYIKNESSYDLLIYKRYLKSEELNNKQYIENKRYIGQLALYLDGCASVSSKLKNTSYGKKALEKRFIKYYDCTGSSIEHQNKTKSFSWDIGITAGISLTSLEFKTSAGFPSLLPLFETISKNDFETSTSFSPGIFFDLVSQKNQKKWSIYNEILFTSYEFSGHFEDSSFPNVISDLEVSFSFLKLNNMFRYNLLSKGQLSFHLNAGISNTLVTKELKNNLRREIPSTGVVSESVPLKVRNEQGGIFGIVAKFKKYSFETRYESSNGISDLTELGSPTKRTYFLFGYTF